MSRLVRSYLLGGLFSLIGVSLGAQEEFVRWLDDDKAVISSMQKGDMKHIAVSLVKGTDKPYKGELISVAEKPAHNHPHRVVVRDQDIFLIKDSGDERQLTDDDEIEKNPKLSADGNFVAYTKAHDLFAFDLVNNVEKRLTYDGSESVYNGWASWVYFEEILGRSSRYAAFWWSPDSKHIAFLHFDDKPVPKFTLFRSEGAHGDLEVNHYPKAGDPNPHVKFGVANIQSGSIVWVAEDEDKDQYSAFPFWTPDGDHLLFQEVNRGQDTLHLVKADPISGKRQVIYEETQPSWVEFYEEVSFFENGDFLLRSNKDGWYNLYRYDLDGNLVTQITDVPWRILEVSAINEKTGKIFFYGTGPDPTNRHFFVANLDGSKVTQLTQGDGWHSVKLSPNQSYLYDQYSSLTNSGSAYLGNIKGEIIRKIDIETFDANQASGVTVERITIPTEDNFDLPGYWVLPKNFDANQRYPVVLSIYGGPDAGTVRNRYTSYADNFFTNHDVILFVMDHRASGKFGKKGMDYMHRSLGKWELLDYIEGVKWLRNKPFVDAGKIGITGGSYGGYLTALALTSAPEYFTHGVSLFPVTDWRLYDNVYTERFMDTPAENPEGYDQGSAIVQAENLRGKLLIVHGMMDDNVHMQNTMQFVSKLQDLNKDFEMMVYPGERHGWGGAKRRHLGNLTNSFWKKHFTDTGKNSARILKP